ncbi:MAG: TIGR02678 family protein [Acidimicrobiaceae bacterium]|nr:TIGR02678 family protein [Acidimicrobiaceae bacterium]MXZ98922.1 TIGR02678 family protein [Acidimicrobiaceae bacterium]MYE76184.1 TIGR02678 family protein [Acidimicrobiaceae bacterium]MYE96804.1 TIGR02678 family protein [Acidimicrobiaceae bacterium]MYH44742.1 TIGR02678 family protein [Acidimicrobiaceae bacterium]
MTSDTAPASADPHRALDLRAAARHLAVRPLVLSESDPDRFRLIRRYEHELDRWFTQRFGYRLEVTADTARLFKSTVAVRRRALRTAADPGRTFSVREYTMLALALAAVAAGPSVISLRDLLHEIRSAATEAGVTVTEATSDRRALVAALKWMIRHGAASEAHDRVDRYATDSGADAVLCIRPDRVALLPLPALARSETVEDLLDRSEQRQSSSRAWMRSALLEEPVLYRSDLADDEWTELRRRLGEESAIFDEMFGLRLEARAEGVAAIDPEDGMTDSRFPRGGTVAHAALLLIDRLTASGSPSVTRNEVVENVASLAGEHGRYWSQRAEDPECLTDTVLELLGDHRLTDIRGETVWLLPAAWRYKADVRIEQGSLL